jgi:tetratricopeptide (TPR) repeat protein
MPFLNIQLTSWSLDANSPVVRHHPRPDAVRHADFEDKFDPLTVFYDCFWLEAGRRIVLLGPPLLNLEADLELNFRSFPGGESCSSRRVSGFHMDLTYVDVPAGTNALHVWSRAADVYLVPQPNLQDLFLHRRVVTTLSKDNEPAWIRDWATYYNRAHGCDGVLIYDNASTRYSVQELQDALGSLKDMQTIVLSWPFRYGLFDGRDPISFGIWDWHPCQNAMLEHARRRFLDTARSVLNVDVDELVLTTGGESVFEMVEESSTGHVRMDGLWVENYPMHVPSKRAAPPRHKDFYHVRAGRRIGCEEKWAVVPARTPEAAQWTVHDVLGMPASEHGRRAQLRHFKALNTNWAAVGRAGDLTKRTASSPADPKLFEPDGLLRDTLARVFPAKSGSDDLPPAPQLNRSATSWRLLAREMGSRGEVAAAIDATRKAIELDDDYPAFRLSLAQLLDVVGRPEEAGCQRTIIRRLRENDAAYRCQRARLHLEERDFSNAEAELVAALAIDPGLPAAHLHMARLLLRSGRRAESLAFLERCAERAPRHALCRATLASRLIDDGRHPEARRHASVAVEADPMNPHYYVVLGEALRLMGRLDEAEQVLLQGIALDQWPGRKRHYSQEVISRNLEPTDRWAQPSAPNLRHQLAYVFLSKRRFDLAEKATLDAIALGPPAVNDHILLARIRALSGSATASADIGTAIRLARQEFDRPSENETSRLSIREREEYSALVLADLLIENHRFEEAEAVLTEGRRRLPDCAALEARHARLLGMMGDRAGATDILDAALLREPCHADLHFALSHVLAGGKDEQAVPAAERACALDPTRGAHHLGLAKLLASEGRLEQAEVVLSRAAATMPEHPEIRIALARVLEQRGDKRGAISTIQDALALGLGNPWLQSHLGELLLQIGNLDAASAALDASAVMDPDDALTQYRLGRLHEMRRDLPSAVPFFRRAAVLAANQGWMWSHLGAILMETGDLDGAREALERSLDLDPESWLNHSRIGRLKEFQGQIEASVRALRAAIGMKPDQGWMWSHLGHLLMQQQLWEDAEAALRQALSLDPADGITKERIGRLQEIRG